MKSTSASHSSTASRACSTFAGFAGQNRQIDIAFFTGLVLLPILVHASIATGAQTLYFNDITELHVPIRSFFGQAWADGRFPLWAPDIYLGFPLFAEGQAGPLYPPNWVLFTLLPAWWAVGLSFVLHCSLAAAGTGLFLRRFVGRPAAFAGGIAFSLTGHLAMHHAHLNLVQAVAWLPWGLWAVERLFALGRLRDFVVLAGIGGTMAMCGHPQSTVQGLSTIGLWGVVRALGGTSREPGDKPRMIAAVSLALLLACGLWMVHVLPILELASGSVRAAGNSLEAQMSAHESIQSLASAVVPSAIGTTGNGTLWLYPGNSLRQGPDLFLGAAAVFLGLLAVLVRRDRWTLALAAFCLLMTLVAMGPLTVGVPSMYRLPFLRGLRFPNRLDAEISFFAATLAAAGLDAVLSGRTRVRHVVIASVAVVVATMSILLVTYQRGIPPTNPLAIELVRDSTIAGLALVAAILGVLLARRFRTAGIAMVVAAVAVPVADFGVRQVPSTDPTYWDQPATVTAIRDAECPEPPCGMQAYLGRVVFRNAPRPYLESGWLRNDLPAAPIDGLKFSLPMVFGLPAVDGILPLMQSAFLDVYKDLHDKPRRSLAALGGRWTVTPNASAIHADSVSVLADAPVMVFEDPTALPRAFAVHQVEVVSSQAKAGARVVTGRQLRMKAILESMPPIPLSKPPFEDSSKVDIDVYEDERVVIDARMAADGLVMLLDSYSSGWTATVDGTPTPILRANSVFRAVPVPEGRHEVEFRYGPAAVYLGGALSAATLALLLALLAIEAFFVARNGRAPSCLVAQPVNSPNQQAESSLVLSLVIMALVCWACMSVILRWETLSSVVRTYGG